MKWRLESPGIFYDADEGSDVYNEPDSGHTHQIGEFDAIQLSQIGKKPMGAAELLRSVQSDVVDRSEAELHDAIVPVLDELVALNILKAL